MHSSLRARPWRVAGAGLMTCAMLLAAAVVHERGAAAQTAPCIVGDSRLTLTGSVSSYPARTTPTPTFRASLAQCVTFVSSSPTIGWAPLAGTVQFTVTGPRSTAATVDSANLENVLDLPSFWSSASRGSYTIRADYDGAALFTQLRPSTASVVLSVVRNVPTTQPPTTQPPTTQPPTTVPVTTTPPTTLPPTVNCVGPADVGNSRVVLTASAANYIGGTTPTPTFTATLGQCVVFVRSTPFIGWAPLSGTVQFSVTGPRSTSATVASVNLANVLDLTSFWSSAPGGAYTVRADYDGVALTSQLRPSTASVTVLVLRPTPTSVPPTTAPPTTTPPTGGTFTLSPAAPHAGQPVTFTAAFPNTGGEGRIDFYTGDIGVGSAYVDATGRGSITQYFWATGATTATATYDDGLGNRRSVVIPVTVLP